MIQVYDWVVGLGLVGGAFRFRFIRRVDVIGLLIPLDNIIHSRSVVGVYVFVLLLERVVEPTPPGQGLPPPSC